MEHKIEYYYQQKSRKKRVKKLKKCFAIVVILFAIFCVNHQIIEAKSVSKYNLNRVAENTIRVIQDNKEEIIIIPDKAKYENVAKKEEQKENWKTLDDISYFKDAVFIGDSRTEGFILNNGLVAKTIEYTHKGLTVDRIFTEKVINKNGKKLTIVEALKETSFSKVYIMLGINETGWVYSDMFINKYIEIINEIKKINPKCTIYIQSIIPVTEKVSNTHKYLKNTKIAQYNSLIEKMATEQKVYYLDVQKAVVSQNGSLPEEASTDGIHLNKEYCEKWFEYLKKHVIKGE